MLDANGRPVAHRVINTNEYFHWVQLEIKLFQNHQTGIFAFSWG